jgi:hypothetical protein
MLADPEAQPPAVGRPEEVRTLDTHRVEDADGVRHAEPHGIRRTVVWLVATSHASVVDVDQAELVSRQGLRDR